jgi:hypothetical protein
LKLGQPAKLLRVAGHRDSNSFVQAQGLYWQGATLVACHRLGCRPSHALAACPKLRVAIQQPQAEKPKATWLDAEQYTHDAGADVRSGQVGSVGCSVEATRLSLDHESHRRPQQHCLRTDGRRPEQRASESPPLPPGSPSSNLQSSASQLAAVCDANRARAPWGGRICSRPPPSHLTETGLTPATSAPGLGSPLPHLQRDWGSTLPRLSRGWAYPCHICIRTALIPAPSKQVRAGASPVLVEMWQSWWRCGQGEPSPGADVVRGEPSPGGDAGGGEPSAGADEALANRPHSNLAHRTIRRVCFGVLPSEAVARKVSGMRRLRPGADVGRGEPSPSTDVAAPVPVQVWAGVRHLGLKPALPSPGRQPASPPPATCNKEHATCNIRHATCNVQRTNYDIQCNVPRGPCGMRRQQCAQHQWQGTKSSTP